MEPEQLDLPSLLAFEVHRPVEFDENYVFHRVQAYVYRELLGGENVVLSAPTSFGKSLLIDATIAAKDYQNVVIVVPTIALIDETRRRLTQRFGGQYKIITRREQVPSVRNIYILTQERVVEFDSFPNLDFFVIDEFYKLDSRSDQSDRSIILNQAFFKLWKTGAQFYMLGPNIVGISAAFGDRFECKLIITDYATVVSEFIRIQASPEERIHTLAGLCNDLDEPTLIYCQSPASARRVVTALVARGVSSSVGLEDAIQWLSRNYHPEWSLVEGLNKGVGIHHGRVPRALAQFIVRAFNEGSIKFLVCTSTLIEGVNTKAKNVIIYDHKISRRTLDYFTFNNIVGRSGRMFEHFIGHVYVFRDPPVEEFPTVLIPLIEQDEDTPDALLINVDESFLTPVAQKRVRKYQEQALLPLEILQANSGIDPDAQLKLADELQNRKSEYYPLLSWRAFPQYRELEVACILIWDFFIPTNQRRGGVSSGKQLTFKVWKFYKAAYGGKNNWVKALIDSELTDEENPDEAVENVLEFLRYWIDFNFPRYLMALSRIQEVVFSPNAGDYALFATSIQNCFLPPGLIPLEEYGIPIQVAQKILPFLEPASSLDESLSRLRTIDVEALDLTPFERDLVADAQRYL